MLYSQGRIGNNKMLPYGQGSWKMKFKPLINNVIYSCILSIALAACTMPSTSALSANNGSCHAGAKQGTSSAGLDQVTLCIQSGKKIRSFTVENAKTSVQQAQGLMFRTSLADNAGMIFPFSDVRAASFWMKNTVIPLDIIFIRANGTIESIAENTIPYSTDPVSSGEPVAAVLELRGGLTGELGIAQGDIISWKAE
jgi:uncharacterized protein